MAMPMEGERVAGRERKRRPTLSGIGALASRPANPYSGRAESREEKSKKGRPARRRVHHPDVRAQPCGT
eukprot:7796288-Pyramimonas_sp.AAC.1